MQWLKGDNALIQRTTIYIVLQFAINGNALYLQVVTLLDTSKKLI